MLSTGERYVLKGFPVIVDPIASALEVQVARCRVGSDGRIEQPGHSPWKQLQRVIVTHDTFPFHLDSSMVQFFGPETDPYACPYMLVYDATGTLRHRIDREDDEFVAYRIAEELNGKSVLLPTVRVSFESPVLAKQFLSVLEGIQAGQPIDPATEDFIKRLLLASKDARFAHVAKRDDRDRK